MGVARPLRAAPTGIEPSPAVVAPFLAAAHRRWLADDSGNQWRRRPASVLVGDVSAITALDERAAAAELTDALNGAVGRLLDAAAAHGGDLLELGGKTTVVAFDGPGHERRATQAAAALPAALRGLHRASTHGQAAMSIGVASGELDLFLVGSDHRQLIVCGPLLSTAVRLERSAEPGEVLVDGTTAAAVNDARWSGPDRGGHGLLIPPPASTVGLGLGPNGAHELPTSTLLTGIPAGLRNRVGIGGEGEHRDVAVACLQVMGVDDLLAEAGHDAVADALDTVIRLAQEACATHHTTFLSTAGGDGTVHVILTAGAPDAGTDDAGRLLLASRKVAATDGPLRVRAGVHHGRAFLVELGSPRRRVCTLLGDAVDLAAVVMGRSTPGGVVATASALEATRTRIGAQALQPFAVGGRTDPVMAAAVGRPLGEDTYAAVAAKPIVGREHERGLLLGALADARAGDRRVVVVRGEAGIGKSRLISEVVAAAPDLPHLHVSGDAHAIDAPYAAVRTSLRSLLGLDALAPEAAVVSALRDVVGRRGEPWLPLLAPAFGAAVPDTDATARVGARLRRPRAHALITAVLHQLLSDHALLVVDDAQWVDDASTQLLHHLLDAFAGAPWLVLVSRRGEPGGFELPSDEVSLVELGRLDRRAVAALLDAGGDDPYPRRVVDALTTRSGGHPLFLEQLRAHVDSGAEVDDLPGTVEAIIAARIARLDPQRRRQLRAASVLGPRFSISQLASILPDDGYDGIRPLEGLIARDDTGWMRFQHELVHAVAYEGLSDRNRRDLHGRVAELLETDATGQIGRAELLASHSMHAKRWASVWRWSRLAAERAATAAAHVEAAGFLRQAVRAAGSLEVERSQLARVYERLADAEELNGRFHDATDALTRARRLTDDPTHVAHLLHRHGQVSDRAGNHPAAQRWFGRGLQQLADGPPTEASERLRIQLVISQAGTKVRQGRLREAARLLDAAVVDAESARDRRALTMARDLQSTVLRELGRSDETSPPAG